MINMIKMINMINRSPEDPSAQLPLTTPGKAI